MWNWKWQWNNQNPGLSALNRSTTYPLFGTAMVSFNGGLPNWRCNKPFRSHSNACFRLIFFTFESGDRPIPITWNDVPCKWNGWLKFVCWTVENKKEKTKDKINLKFSMLEMDCFYLHRLRRLRRLHSMGCQRYACTCNSYHNLVADCHRCRTVPAECHVFARASVMVATHTKFHQSAISSDRPRVPLKSDCMCLAGTLLPVDRNRNETVEKSWRRDARREHLCPVSLHSSNC